MSRKHAAACCSQPLPALWGGSHQNQPLLACLPSAASEALAAHCLPTPSPAPQVVAEDQDYLVFSVVLFRRVVDNFKTAARTKGFQARWGWLVSAGAVGCGGAGPCSSLPPRPPGLWPPTLLQQLASSPIRLPTCFSHTH